MSIESKWAEMARKPAPITLAPIHRPAKVKAKPTISPEQREAMAERMRKRWQDPGFRERRMAASKAANARNWADPETRAKIAANLKNNESKRMARSRLANAERYSDPAEREKTRQFAIMLHREGRLNAKAPRKISAQGRANKIAATKRAHDKRRGFSIPFHLKAQYRFLTVKKKLKAREAGIALGIINPNGTLRIQKQAA